MNRKPMLTKTQRELVKQLVEDEGESRAAAVALGGPHRAVSFAVPTGNFGDVLAGWFAKQMGLPPRYWKI